MGVAKPFQHPRFEKKHKSECEESASTSAVNPQGFFLLDQQETIQEVCISFVLLIFKIKAQQEYW